MKSILSAGGGSRWLEPSCGPHSLASLIVWGWPLQGSPVDVLTLHTHMDSRDTFVPGARLRSSLPRLRETVRLQKSTHVDVEGQNGRTTQRLLDHIAQQNARERTLFTKLTRGIFN